MAVASLFSPMRTARGTAAVPQPIRRIAWLAFLSHSASILLPAVHVFAHGAEPECEQCLHEQPALVRVCDGDCHDPTHHHHGHDGHGHSTCPFCRTPSLPHAAILVPGVWTATATAGKPAASTPADAPLSSEYACSVTIRGPPAA
jgi:hypothetical protein